MTRKLLRWWNFRVNFIIFGCEKQAPQSINQNFVYLWVVSYWEIKVLVDFFHVAVVHQDRPKQCSFFKLQFLANLFKPVDNQRTSLNKTLRIKSLPLCVDRTKLLLFWMLVWYQPSLSSQSMYLLVASSHYSSSNINRSMFSVHQLHAHHKDVWTFFLSGRLYDQIWARRFHTTDSYIQKNPRSNLDVYWSRHSSTNTK